MKSIQKILKVVMSCLTLMAITTSSMSTSISLVNTTIKFSQKIEITNNTDSDSSMSISVYYSNSMGSSSYVRYETVTAGGSSSFSMSNINIDKSSSMEAKFTFKTGVSGLGSSDGDSSCIVVADYDSDDSGITSQSYSTDSCDSIYALTATSGDTIKIELPN